jgi:hypothetical protein
MLLSQKTNRFKGLEIIDISPPNTEENIIELRSNLAG